MFFLNLKLAIRNIIRYKFYTFINIIGLSIGFLSFILTSLFLKYEHNWDTHNVKYDRIYRIQRRMENTIFAAPGNEISPHTRGITKKLLVDNYPEFEQIAILSEFQDMFLSSSPRQLFYEKYGIGTEQSFLDIFTFDFKEGNQNGALVDPYTLIISESLAAKLFPNKKALGETVMIDKKHNLKVTGVYKDLPENSIIQPNYIVSLSTLEERDDIKNSWSGSYMTYSLLRPGEDYKTVNKRIVDLFREYKLAENEKIFLCPLSKLYLNFNDRNDYIYILFLFRFIGIFILLLAAFNYINLTTANASVRSKEIGIRKVFGSSRRTLAGQFMGEAVIIALISLLFAMIIVQYILPGFNRVTGKTIEFVWMKDLRFILLTVAIAVLTGLFSGIYPAVFMASRKTVNLFKGEFFRIKKEKLSLRKILVTFQYSIVILLIILTLSFSMQIDYILKKDVGFNKENLLFTTVRVSREDINYEDLRNRLLNNAAIENMSISKFLPLINFGGIFMKPEGEGEESVFMRNNIGSVDFVKTLGMSITQGRDFSRDFLSDQGKACIINETARKSFGWDDPIGKFISDQSQHKYEIVGVVNDFHNNDMYNIIEPYVLQLYSGSVSGEWMFSFRITPGKLEEAQKIIENELESLFTNDPFELTVYNTAYSRNSILRIYETIKNTIRFFTILNLFLAVIGLLGLISFTIHRRTKEICIRKINGSDSLNIFAMLNREHLILLIFSSLISWPTAWWLYHNFPGPYKFTLQIWIFILPSVLVLILAILTTIFYNIRGALINPADSLRYE